MVPKETGAEITLSYREFSILHFNSSSIDMLENLLEMYRGILVATIFTIRSSNMSNDDQLITAAYSNRHGPVARGWLTG